MWCLALCCLACLPLAAQQAVEIDKNITNKVETELAWQMNIPADDIDVQTNEGIVLLKGRVDNLLAKERAGNVAGAIRNVRGVVNEINVVPPYVPNNKLVADISQALLVDPATDSYEIKVKANMGDVTLSGTVESWTEKNLSEYVAKGVRGVKSIKNDIDVRSVADRPDNEIKTDIEQAISNDIRLYPRTVNVNVRNGYVTLSGTVGSWNDLLLARNHAWVAGVANVDSKLLTIDTWADNSNLRNKTYVMRTDKEIRSAVNDAFLYDPRVLSFKPDISVDEGVITLSGTVSSLSAKRAAGSDAQNVVGVVLVKNNLKVRPDNVPADSTLRTRVDEALHRSAEVDHLAINVAARDGKIYLNGLVDNYYELYRAEAIAANVKGVKEVMNNIGVTYSKDYGFYYPNGIFDHYYPSPFTRPGSYYSYPLSDGQIKENIEDELWWSPFVNESDITVTVLGKVATLTGTIDSWRARNAAIENAYEGGAYSVIDQMAIEYNTN